MTREEYHKIRQEFQPDPIRLVIVAESPPASGKYFYKRDGLVTEPLFSALMKELSYHPRSKDDGLTEFKRRGWILVDATYQPVNGYKDRDRNRTIEKDYDDLCHDLSSLTQGRSTPIILIKANVCRILGPKLRQHGFNVLNGESLVYFPSNGRQKDFHCQFAAILKFGEPTN